MQACSLKFCTAIDRPAVQDWIRWQMTQPTARSRAAAERAARAGTPAPPLEPVSPKTVRNNVSNVLAKLQVTDRAEAIVRATTFFDDPDMLAKVSRGLGEAMVGINVDDLPVGHRLAERGW